MQSAAKLLIQGEVVAFPTETVYALAADAQNEAALIKLFALKNRPMDKALSLLIGETSAVDFFAQNIAPAARDLIHAFFPGPLTLILERSQNVPKMVTSGRNSVGLRMPNHKIALGVLREFARLKKTPAALAAPSANRTNALSATSFEHVLNAFNEKIPRILKGECQVGLESSIVDCTKTPFLLLRRGAIALKDLQKVVPQIEMLEKTDFQKPPSPVFLMAKNKIADFLNQNPNQKIVLLGFEKPKYFEYVWRAMPNNPKDFAREIYNALHFAESQNADIVILESPPKTENWQTIWAFFHGQRRIFLKKN